MDESTKKICISILLNLLELHRKDDRVINGFVRELFSTENCDKFFDLSSEREKYEKFIGKETLTRIINFEETERDNKISAQAVLHNYSTTSKKLERSLPFKELGIYYITNKGHNTLATIGIVSSIYAFYNIIKKI